MINIINKAKLWTVYPFDKETRELVNKLIISNDSELEDSFYKNLEFGTGGIRGIMGVGTNRLNKYTLGRVAQGLSNYLKKEFSTKVSIVIAYDVRNNSKKFASIITDVFTANGIYTYLFKNFCSTPELSFAIRYLKCQAGIMLTASHNPPEYNGCKVYLSDGAQVVPPQDYHIITKIYNVNFFDINFNKNDKLISIIGDEINKKFIQVSLNFGSYVKNANSNLNIVFTPMHGTTTVIIPKMLKKVGFNHISVIKKQSIPNGDFPTTKSLNPEDPEFFQMAIEKAIQIDADLIIGTDPDGDRLGIIARDQKGKFKFLNGNQTNTLLTNYLLNIWNKQEKKLKNAFIASTIVTSDIFLELAKLYGVECKIGLTGFKWIGKMIHDYENKQKFICGGEESFGFMIDTFVRDKDAITSSLLICEIAAQAKKYKKTLFEVLAEIYFKVGFYLEDLMCISKIGKGGLENIKILMNNYRSNPPKELGGKKVIRLDDYQSLISKNLVTGTTEVILMPPSNVLIFYTENGSKIACRPSGTESKIKYYFSVKSQLNSIKDYESIEIHLKKEIEKLKISFYRDNNKKINT